MPGPQPITEIVQAWRLRQRWHRAEKSLTLQGKALCRSWTGGDKEAATALFDKAKAGGSGDLHLDMALLPFLAAISRFEQDRKGIEKSLHRMAKSLPIWDWVKSVKGFGPGNFAAIVGEAGDVGGYRGVACLWKRMGLAVIEGKRQRKVANVDEALVHGYSPARRAVAYLLSDTLIRSKSPHYYALYQDRKAYELARDDEGKPASLLHAHKRAARVMVKRVLRDLYLNWRRIPIRGDRDNDETRVNNVVANRASGHSGDEAHTSIAGGSPSSIRDDRRTDETQTVNVAANRASGLIADETHGALAGGSPNRAGRLIHEAQRANASSRAPDQPATETQVSGVGGSTAPGQPDGEAQKRNAGGQPLAGRRVSEAHYANAGKRAPDQIIGEARKFRVGGSPPITGQLFCEAQEQHAGKRAPDQRSGGENRRRPVGGS